MTDESPKMWALSPGPTQTPFHEVVEAFHARGRSLICDGGCSPAVVPRRLYEAAKEYASKHQLAADAKAYLLKASAQGASEAVNEHRRLGGRYPVTQPKPLATGEKPRTGWPRGSGPEAEQEKAAADQRWEQLKKGTYEFNESG